ncbi:MAG: hypothetical protein LQ344_007315 [Seirophora lacunosa]|nr:MAG: hypothetical protein LQ344_007315 [Seirophora lacunosa]
MENTRRNRRQVDDIYKPRKKQKIGDGASIKQDTNAESVTLEALPWSQVNIPDRLDDAEGFFGLEEISDVEIVRDEKLGRVEYRLPSSAARHTANAPDSKEEIEWEGFDESQSESDGDRPKPDHSPKDLEAPAVHASKKLKRNTPVKLPKSNGFDVLQDDSVDEVDVSAWNHLRLPSEILTSLAKLHFAQPTLIQSSSIPEIIDGHDVIGKASTGSGKTLAFGIPILDYYLRQSHDSHRSRSERSTEERRYPPAALILSPTRELAHQLSAHLTDLCSNVNSAKPTIATLTGGLSLQKQQRILANADIIIGTPGRLWEIISSSKGLMPWLVQTKFLVLDEADRLLSQGHYKELEEILNALDRINDDGQISKPGESAPNIHHSTQSRQTLIFSATFAPSLQSKLSGHLKAHNSSSSTDSLTHLLRRLNFRTTPKFIDASPLSHLPTSLSEHIVECSALEKDLYLYALLLCHFPASRTLVFTNSINSVRRLVPFLQNLNLPAHALHSQMPQKARLRSLERFSASTTKDEGKTEKGGSILVATDVAARGLDIPNVSAVLHYHLPRAADAYVHRSGRTARKGLPGASVLICSPEEVQGMRRLVVKVHATSSSSTAPNQGIRTLDLDRRIVARLKQRTVLAKDIADAGMAKGKKGHEDKWLRDAAEELGVEYDSEAFRDGSGKGKGKKRKGERARGASGQDIAGMKAELKALLARRVNVGVSERYLSAGGWDVEALLEGGGGGEFLGRVGG